MEKKLVVVGNGLALFIDKTLQQLLGICRDTLVDVSTDGVRLTIEPCGVVKKRSRVEPWNAPNFLRWSRSDDPEQRRVEYYAPQVFQALLKHGLDYEHTLRLNHRYWTVDHIAALVQGLRHTYLDEHDRDDLARLEICLAGLDGGLGWDQAISAALEKVPIRAIVPWFRHHIFCPPELDPQRQSPRARRRDDHAGQCDADNPAPAHDDASKPL